MAAAGKTPHRVNFEQPLLCIPVVFLWNNVK